MIKTYRTTKQWDHWLTHSLGRHVIEAEKKFLLRYLEKNFGKHTLLIGVPEQHELLNASVTARHTLLTPLINKNPSVTAIEGELYDLPIASGRVDLVLLPHTLEYVDNPHQLLSEACRIVKPEGHLIILGFNPFSMWGIKKSFTKSKAVPWSANFIHAGTVKKWLGLADFELVNQETVFFRPPMQHAHRVYRKLKFLEWIGSRYFKPFGGIYILAAKAKMIPLTPIRMQWKQTISAVRAITPGPSMRDFP